MVTAELGVVAGAAARLVANASRHARSSVAVRVAVERGPWVRVAGAGRPPLRVEEAAASVGASATAWLVVAVSDDGPGVSVAARQSLFRAFAAVSDGSGTTGLGLAMVLRDSERLGGTAGYNGVSFWLAVPVADAGAASEPELTYRADLTRRHGIPAVHGSLVGDSGISLAKAQGESTRKAGVGMREESGLAMPGPSLGRLAAGSAAQSSSVIDPDVSGPSATGARADGQAAQTHGSRSIASTEPTSRPKEERQERRRARQLRSRRAARPDTDDIVLVMDDNPSIRASLARTLRRAGATIVEAGHGRAAIEVLQAMGDSRSRLVGAVVDRDMPVMDGVELLHALSLPPLAPVPAVMLTGSISDATRAEALQAGALEVVLKPIDARGVARILALLKQQGDVKPGPS